MSLRGFLVRLCVGMALCLAFLGSAAAQTGMRGCLLEGEFGLPNHLQVNILPFSTMPKYSSGLYFGVSTFTFGSAQSPSATSAGSGSSSSSSSSSNSDSITWGSLFPVNAGLAFPINNGKTMLTVGGELGLLGKPYVDLGGRLYFGMKNPIAFYIKGGLCFISKNAGLIGSSSSSGSSRSGTITMAYASVGLALVNTFN